MRLSLVKSASTIKGSKDWQLSEFQVSQDYDEVIEFSLYGVNEDGAYKKSCVLAYDSKDGLVCVILRNIYQSHITDKVQPAHEGHQ